MPELPEVETVRRGLERMVPSGTRIERVRLMRRDLRAPFPRGLARRLEGEPVLRFRRHGKYLLWDTPRAIVVCHLGMSGTWRDATADAAAATTDDAAAVHDHCFVHLAGGRVLAFRDPRRFGLIDLAVPGREADHAGLALLGPDALDRDAFTAAYLAKRLAGRKAAIKVLLLDQRLVAGVGNIYAVEALHRAGIRPIARAGGISRPRLERLVAAVDEVLLQAIEAGGSTLNDYRQADGSSGAFQDRFRVYDRAGQPCLACRTPLKGAVLAARSTVWCPRCQR